MCKTKWVCSLFLFASLSIPIRAANVLTGDENAATDETFSFRVQQHELSNAPDLIGTYLYVGAHPSDGGTDAVKQFAVSRVARDTSQFVGLTPDKVTLNVSKDVANPLYDQGIAFLKLFNGESSELEGAPERPVVVTNADRKTIYFINRFRADGTNVEVVSVQSGTQNITDANAAITAGIVQLEAVSPYVFTAVRPTSGVFGASGSGIALVVIGSVPVVSGGTFTGPIIIDAPTGSVARSGGQRAMPLDVTSSELKIGSDLASIGSIVDMCWHSKMSRLYIALQVTGAGAGPDGARALVVGRVDDNNKLELSPIAPTAVFDGSLDKIVGVQTADAQVSIHKLREMFTSTALPYLVMVGGVGAPAATQKTVFAVPLVNGSTDAAVNGTIASKNADPEGKFTPTTIPYFICNVITQQATTAAQMPLSTDAATQVGGGAIVNGDITDLWVQGDTVFASVESATGSQVPGIFYSQAFFDEKGKIKRWTTWRRAAGTRDNVQSSVLDPVSAKNYFLAQNSSGDVKLVKRTSWESGDTNGLSPIIASSNMLFPKAYAGVQGVNDFVVTSTVLDTETPGLLDSSLLVATGYKKIYLAQTSGVVSDVVIPYGGSAFGPLISFTNGEITQTFPVSSSKQISIEGGVLDDIGPIVTAEVAKDGSSGSNGWLFVGGTGGIAVLSKVDGSGWDTSTGLSVNFTGLTAGMSFKTVGTYQHVRRLVHDDQYLYVLTETQLDRIDLTQSNVGLGLLSVTTIATNATIQGVGARGTLLDVLISEKLAVIATSSGLFRINDSLDVRSVNTISALWQLLATPEDIGAIRQIVAVTQTGRAQDCARKTNGGNFYVLSAYRGKDQAKLFRFAVQQVVGSGVTSTTVQRIPDLFVQNIPSYFASFGLFRNLCATDGALFFGTRGKADDEHSIVSVLFSKNGVHTGSGFLSNKEIPVNLDESTLIASMIQSSATGSWLVAGDQGIQANE